MLTFYDHRGIYITAKYVAVDGDRYSVRDLHEVRAARGPFHRIAVSALGGGGSLLALALVLSAVTPAPMTAAFGLAGLLGLGTAFVVGRTHPREQLLWANFRGVELLMLATRDSIEVGKLTRALRRALEHDARTATTSLADLPASTR